jgi:hypothetical protein
MDWWWGDPTEEGDWATMNISFQAELLSWTPFYGFVGTAAVTLLGLLFVAVSLRLNVFRDPRTADVRDFARLTLFGFLAPMVITGLTLMPHEQPAMLAIPLFVLAIVGVLATTYLVREWLQLNPASSEETPGPKPWQWQGWSYLAMVGLPYLGLAIVAALFLLEHGIVFAALAGVEGLMLISGTISAWIMLMNAGEAVAAERSDEH